MAREFTAYVIAAGQRFKPGDKVPADLDDLIGSHVTQGVSKRSGSATNESPANESTGSAEAPATSAEGGADADEGEESYLDWTKEQLRQEVDGRELDVPKSANKAEMAAALEADDAEHEDAE